MFVRRSNHVPSECDGCGRLVDVLLVDGWWSYPAGWWYKEFERCSLLVCSIECMEKAMIKCEKQHVH